MNELISVIVPVYNVEQYLRQCVNSILRQTYIRIEVILIDDGSSDGSAKICDEYAQKDTRVRVLHKVNEGVSVARNIGIQISKGEYIGFVDADDYIEPDMYEKLLCAIEKGGEECKISCCGRYLIFDESSRKKRAFSLTPGITGVISSEEMLQKILQLNECDSVMWDKLFHRSLFSDIFFPNMKIYEDMAIMYRLIDLSPKIFLIAEPLYNYRQRAQSATTSSFSEEQLYAIKNSKEIINFVKERYPNVLHDAEKHYVKKCLIICVMVNTSNKNTRKRFQVEYKQLLNILGNNKNNLAKNDKFKYYLLRAKVHRIFHTINRFRRVLFCE